MLPTTTQARRMESTLRGLTPDNYTRESYKINGDLAIMFGMTADLGNDVKRGSGDQTDRWFQSGKALWTWQAPNFVKSVDAALQIVNLLKQDNHVIGRNQQHLMVDAATNVSDFTDKGFTFQNAMALSLMCLILERLSL